MMRQAIARLLLVSVALTAPAVAVSCVGGGRAEPVVERSPKQLWRFQTGGQVESSPTVVDGVVYIGSNNRCVYAITEE